MGVSISTNADFRASSMEDSTGPARALAPLLSFRFARVGCSCFGCARFGCRRFPRLLPAGRGVVRARSGHEASAATCSLLLRKIHVAVEPFVQRASLTPPASPSRSLLSPSLLSPSLLAPHTALASLLAFAGASSGARPLHAQTQAGEYVPEEEGAPPPETPVAVEGDEYADTDPSALTDFRATLDPHGTWIDDPTYGQLWVPNVEEVGTNFAPYVTEGSWAYEEDYVWVSNYEWGWVPFHYGRWTWASGRWGWVPGRTYAGAWVGWRVGPDGYGYVGWGPLAPSFGWQGASRTGSARGRLAAGARRLRRSRVPLRAARRDADRGRRADGDDRRGDAPVRAACRARGRARPVTGWARNPGVGRRPDRCVERELRAGEGVRASVDGASARRPRSRRAPSERGATQVRRGGRRPRPRTSSGPPLCARRRLIPEEHPDAETGSQNTPRSRVDPMPRTRAQDERAPAAALRLGQELARGALRMRSREFVTALAIASAWFAAALPARAQEPTGSAPALRLQPFAAIPPPAPVGSPLAAFFGEPTGDAGAPPGYFASAPLRLTLQNEILPMGGAYEQCGTRGDAAGNSTGGIPTQHYTLLRLTPNLVLHGFAAGGCPIDGAIGGAITYSAQVAPSLWLVAGAGIYAAPAPAQLAGARTRTDFQVDLVKKVNDTRSFSVGIGKRGVSFGGAF